MSGSRSPTTRSPGSTKYAPPPPPPRGRTDVDERVACSRRRRVTSRRWGEQPDECSSMIFRFSLIALVSLTVMSGCASRGGGEWRGVPEETMPATLNAWDVYWDDSRQNWREARSDTRVEHSAVPTESWEFESNAIALRIEASEELNRFRGASHTLLLHIYQVRDPGGVT